MLRGKLIVGLAGLLPLLAGCQQQYLNEEEKVIAGESMKHELPLVAVSNPRLHGSTLAFTAISTGCTESSDFTAVATAVDNQCQVRINRKVPDLCQATAKPVSLEIELQLPDNCQDLPVVFENPAIAGS